MEIFKNLTNIQSAIKFYSTIAKLSIILLTVGIIAISALFIINTEKNKDSIYILTNTGVALQATQGSIKENRRLEAEAHVRLFISLFFDIDKFNYTERINQSYDMGTTCIYNLHQKFVSDNWYTNVVQYNILQTVLIESVESTSTSEPFNVNAKFQVIVRSEAAPEITYTIEMRFNVINGKDRSTNNPHAMLINNIEIINFSTK